MNGNAKDLRTPLKRAYGLGSAKDGTHHFIWQRITAVATGLSGLWLLGMLLSMRTAEYAFVHGLVADPVNATALIAFLIGIFWHAKLGLQVIVEDYIHAPLAGAVAHLAILFICALAAIASVLAVLRIALGS
ncbi:succinate dehydrogenase, hydrophobic membrane anchor protein [Thermomonas sp. LB-4]|uniref:succinate dehydrogenase, hydrophobic membrane anchor protein n=1 Tax=Thermomonas sp. LB-4 TaxID=3102790 RepID=UPI002ED7DD08